MMEWKDFIGSSVTATVGCKPDFARLLVINEDDPVTLTRCTPRVSTNCKTFTADHLGTTLFVKWIRNTWTDECAACLALTEPIGEIAPFMSGKVDGKNEGVTVAPFRPAYKPTTEHMMLDVLRLIIAVDAAGVVYTDYKVPNLVMGPAGDPQLVDIAELYPPLRQRAVVERVRAKMPDQTPFICTDVDPRYQQVARHTLFTSMSMTFIPLDIAERIPFRHFEFEMYHQGAIPTMVRVDTDADERAALDEFRLLGRIGAVWALKLMVLALNTPESYHKPRRMHARLRGRFPRVLDWCDWVLSRIESGHGNSAWIKLREASQYPVLPPVPR